MSRVEVEGIFEEIDEQLEAENAARLWKQYQPWIITSVVALFLGLFAYTGWTEYQKKRDQEVSERYFAALDGADEKTDAGLRAVAEGYGAHGYALLARLTTARTLNDAGKTDEAVRILEEVAGQANPPLKDLALLQAGYVLADDAKRAMTQLEKIGRDSVFKPHALELTGVLTAAGGDQTQALANYKDALSLKPEGGLRKRLEQRIQRMGG
ncbi:MAG: tetratricopeptide repeat protein [Magnetococcales bacterium]|nr:tetratricopeptide repeat protein [Magnetococcales bacterium]